MAIIFILGLSFAFGCNKSKAQTSSTPQTPLPATTQASAPARDTEPTGRLYLAGIKSPDEAREFLEKLQKATAQNDRVAVAALVHFPFTTYRNGTAVKTYLSAAKLLKDFGHIFTPKVLRQIRRARYETLFVNSRGVMIGDGEVWFKETSDGVEITAVNG